VGKNCQILGEPNKTVGKSTDRPDLKRFIKKLTVVNLRKIFFPLNTPKKLQLKKKNDF